MRASLCLMISGEIDAGDHELSQGPAWFSGYLMRVRLYHEILSEFGSHDIS